MTLKQVHKMDKDFWCDERCNACGICARICPANNIELKEGSPAWQHHCEQCLACIQWCPQQSIQFGKKTPAYERYHHPDIALKDMID
jgi:MinD superfamily P-loop ATPase